jgi:hypothetical protein
MQSTSAQMKTVLKTGCLETITQEITQDLPLNLAGFRRSDIFRAW